MAEWLYKKRKMTGDWLTDIIASWWNVRVLRRVVIRIAINWHKETRRRVDILEHHDHYALIDSVTRDGINNKLPGGKMRVDELYKHSIWTSDSLRNKNICPVCRKTHKLATKTEKS